MRDVRHAVSALVRPFPELERQQRVRGLIRRKVGCDVHDPHIVSADDEAMYARLNSENVAGTAPSSCRAKAKNRSSRPKNAPSSSRVLLYGLPPTMASLEWNRRFRTGSPSRARSRASDTMSSKDEYDGRSHRTCATPSFRRTRFVVYGRGARAYRYWRRRGRRRLSAADTGTSSTLLVPGLVALS